MKSVMPSAILIQPSSSGISNSSIPNEQRRTRFLRTMLAIEVRINDGPADFFTAKEDGNIAAVEPCHSLGGQTWYLNLLTVEPNQKGQGFGSRMLRECILPYVRDHGGETLCLFTNAEANRKFYQKNGFEEFDQRFFNRKGKQLGSCSYRNCRL